MRVQTLRSEDRSRWPRLFDATHRQRHDVFAISLGWSELRSDTGLEVDQFDDEHAVYLLAIDEEEVCGSLRLLPSARRSMLAECWPQCIGANTTPFDALTWEWTRWCPGVTARPRQLIVSRKALIRAATTFARAQGGERFVTFCETRFLSQIQALGWAPRVLGPSWAYVQGEAVAIEWAIGAGPVVPGRRRPATLSRGFALNLRNTA